MKVFLCVSRCVLLLICVVGCSTAGRMNQPTAKVDNTAGAAPLPQYAGPQARIAVADFDIKAAKATGEIGSGLREMLITALVNSNRFKVVEWQPLEHAMQEQESAVSNAMVKEGGAHRGELNIADLLITAAVTEFEPQASGGAGGVGGGGGAGSGVLGGLLGAALNKAHMALDIRVVNATTSEVLAATRVQGQASDVAGGFMGVYSGGGALGAGLAGFANTPMEKAIRICIIEAARYISQTVPAKYYKN